MSRLEEVFDIRETILSKLIEDELLVDAITSETLVDASELLYKNIFPYKKDFNETLEEKRNFITIDYAASGLINNNFKNFAITFYVLVHEDFILMDYNSRTVLRVDYLAHRIDTIFNKLNGFGIGKLDFEGYRPLEAPPGFIGAALIYSTVEFN